jgi:hypothetical protein
MTYDNDERSVTKTMRWKKDLSSSAIVIIITLLGGSIVWLGDVYKSADDLFSKILAITNYYSSNEYLVSNFVKLYLPSDAQSEVTYIVPNC